MLSSAEPASTAVVKAESSSGAIAKACSGAGNVPPAHLVGVGLDALVHRLADVREALHELRLERLGAVHVEQVVEDEHLAVGAGAEPMPIVGIVSRFEIAAETASGTHSSTMREASGRLERERVVVSRLA